jgi:hypothetical protein
MANKMGFQQKMYVTDDEIIRSKHVVEVELGIELLHGTPRV